MSTEPKQTVNRINVDEDIDNYILSNFLTSEEWINMSRVCRIYYYKTYEKLFKYRIFFKIWLPKLKEKNKINNDRLEKYEKYDYTKYAIKYGDLDIFKYCHKMEYLSKFKELKFIELEEYLILRYRNDIIDYLVSIKQININDKYFIIFCSAFNLKYLTNYFNNIISKKLLNTENITGELSWYIKNSLVVGNIKNLIYLMSLFGSNNDIKYIDEFELNSNLLIILMVAPKYFKYIYSLINDINIIYQRNHTIIQFLYMR